MNEVIKKAVIKVKKLKKKSDIYLSIGLVTTAMALYLCVSALCIRYGVDGNITKAHWFAIIGCVLGLTANALISYSNKLYRKWQKWCKQLRQRVKEERRRAA